MPVRRAHDVQALGGGDQVGELALLAQRVQPVAVDAPDHDGNLDRAQRRIDAASPAPEVAEAGVRSVPPRSKSPPCHAGSDVTASTCAVWVATRSALASAPTASSSAAPTRDGCPIAHSPAHAVHRAAQPSGEALDAQLLGEQRLGRHLVPHRHGREARAPRAAVRGR